MHQREHQTNVPMKLQAQQHNSNTLASVNKENLNVTGESELGQTNGQCADENHTQLCR